MGLFLSAQTMPFTAAFVLLIGLTVLQIISTLSGDVVDGFVDQLIPDKPDALGWLHVGRAPLLVLLILFLASFAITGYALQMAARGLFGAYLPALIAVVPAAAAGVAGVRTLGGLVAQYMPTSETEAVSEASFIGRTAVIVMGEATRGNPAQARLDDEHGLTHYVMVEPDLDGARFAGGDSVLLVRKDGGRFAAIANPHPDLL